MGILDKAVEEIKKKDFTKQKVRTYSKKIKKSKTGNTADDILQDEGEVQRLSQYIDEKEQKKVIDLKSGVNHGVDKIGTVRDSHGVLKDLLRGASQKSKLQASKVLVEKWAEKNLVQNIQTKTEKVIKGMKISKNIYLKQVSYLRNGKTVKYLQARNLATGRMVKMAVAKRLLGKFNKR